MTDNGTVRVEAYKLDNITAELIDASQDMQVVMERLRLRMTTEAEREDLAMLREIGAAIRRARSGISKIHPYGTESNRAEVAQP